MKIIVGLLFFPFLVFGEVRITEIMYDLSGADTGREWVEIYNNGPEVTDITDWKFFDGSNHILNAPPKNGGTGTLSIPAHSYAILADDASVFITEHSVTVSVTDTVISLGQQKDKTYIVKIFNSDGNEIDSASYSIDTGANGDGDSIQLISSIWKPALPTPGAANTNEINEPTPSTDTNEETATSSAPVASAPLSTSVVPSEPVPSLLVKISGPQLATVGADATFSATVFGVKKEPIPNARVVWNFGNGMSKEGISVRYGYNIPGRYAVIADASSAGLAGSARLVVQAVKPDVRIAQVASGAQGFIEIENKNNTELDVSGWGIASGGALFTIPDKTILLPHAKVAFPADALQFIVLENDARLLFPNGTVAAEYVVPPPPSPLDKIETTQKPPLRLADSAPPLKKGQDAENIIATTTPAAIALSSENGSTIWKWMLGVLGAGGVGAAALVAFRFKPIQKDERNDAEKLADEIQIV